MTQAEKPALPHLPKGENRTVHSFEVDSHHRSSKTR